MNRSLEYALYVDVNGHIKTIVQVLEPGPGKDGIQMTQFLNMLYIYSNCKKCRTGIHCEFYPMSIRWAAEVGMDDVTP